MKTPAMEMDDIINATTHAIISANWSFSHDGFHELVQPVYTQNRIYIDWNLEIPNLWTFLHRNFTKDDQKSIQNVSDVINNLLPLQCKLENKYITHEQQN